jgi:hypothetical protein
MERCSLCNGRLMQTDLGNRCLNDNCENSKIEKKQGVLCQECHETLIFRRNTAYGDRISFCPSCGKEFTL